jgi:hypothetical protein
MEIEMSEPESNPAGKARAAALRAEIDKLAGGKKPAATDGNKDKPANPRDYIHQWMAEHDKKPEE